MEIFTLRLSLGTGQTEVNRADRDIPCSSQSCRGSMRYGEIGSCLVRLNGTQFNIRGVSAWECSECRNRKFLPSVRRRINADCQSALALLHIN